MGFNFLIQWLHQTKKKCLYCHSDCSAESHLSNIADNQTPGTLAYKSPTSIAPVENKCLPGWMPGYSTLQSALQYRVCTEGKHGITQCQRKFIFRTGADWSLHNVELQNHRMVWAGSDLKDYLVATPLPWAGMPLARQGCPESHLTWPWIRPWMGNSQLRWAMCSV